MGDKSKISWCNATWNPIVGCTIVSPACTNCYAMQWANQMLDGNPKSPHYDGTTKKVNGNAVWTGKINIAPDSILNKPLDWRKPRIIFVNSMSDLFHVDVPDKWIDMIIEVIKQCPQHRFLVLTKRPQRMRDYMVNYYMKHTEVPHNLWLGVTAENQETANERVPLLLETPAFIRFVSAEPLLGPIDFSKVYEGKENSYSSKAEPYPKLDWVIVGGESGKNARPTHPDWIMDILHECNQFNTPFFFKQWGEFCPCYVSIGGFTPHDAPDFKDLVRRWENGEILGEGIKLLRRGKKRTGNMLDGKIYENVPSDEYLAKRAAQVNKRGYC